MSGLAVPIVRTHSTYLSQRNLFGGGECSVGLLELAYLLLQLDVLELLRRSLGRHLAHGLRVLAHLNRKARCCVV